jgi:predicted TIM-barrel fold metal-dependent hydrolase
VRDPEMLIHGLANDVFLDDKRFWPIFERAQALDVPLYLHPSVPLPASERGGLRDETGIVALPGWNRVFSRHRMSPGFMAFTAADARSPMQSSANATGRSRTAAIAGANGLSDCAGSGAMDAYYKDYAKDFPMVVRAAWGYTVETATQAIRLVLGGVFDAYPRLKVVLGHLGETLPFLVWRVGQAPARARRR